MEQTTAVRQLRLIADVLRIARRAGVELWLRGGWAVDFTLGTVSRDHSDIDWFCWQEQADSLTAALIDAGYQPDQSVPADQQRNFSLDGVVLSFALLALDSVGQVIVAGGPYAGEPWPAGMLDAVPGRIGSATAPVISAEAQIEIKEMMPIWVPGLPVRPKDAIDTELLRAWLERH